MINIDNIFSYATRELTQDAFLRWLITNWNSEHLDVKTTSLSLIREFLAFNDDEYLDISNLEAKSQEGKIDILVFLTVNKDKHLIAIEDKTDSYEHDNQICKYKKYIEKYYADRKTHYVFYKTSPMNDEEMSFIKSKKWDVYDINRIYRLFQSLNVTFNHYLLKSYFEHIGFLHQAYTGELPDNLKDWSLKHWQNYSTKQNITLPVDIGKWIGNYQNKYIWFDYNLKDQWNQLPYLEFRSRDMSYGEFHVRILIYGIDKEIVEKNLDVWKIRINKSQLFNKQDNEKQIGLSIVKEKASTIEQAEMIMIKYIEEFSRIMKI